MTSRLSEVERAALAAVDHDFLVSTLADLVAIPSLSAQEEPAQRSVAETLTVAGATVEMFPLDVDALRAHPAFSAEYERPAPSGVRGALGDGRNGRTLVLNGHTDVVPPGNKDEWTYGPFTPTVVDGRLYGRGACDMKGGLVAAMTALKAIHDANVSLGGRLLIDAVVGEEDGGCGTLGSLLHGLSVDGAIVLEPTHLAVSPAVAGALTFHVTIPGQAAHGCLREEGVSAIEKLPVVQDALLDLERRRNERDAEELFAWLDRPFAICAGRVEGGDWASSEADWLRLEGRYGVAPDEDLDDAQAEFETAVARAAAADPWLADHPPTVEWVGAQFMPGRTDPSSPVAQTLVNAVAATRAEKPVVRGQPYGCDLGLLSRVGGIPTVVFGPGDIRQAHAVDEWVGLEEVIQAARALTVAAIRFCR